MREAIALPRRASAPAPASRALLLFPFVAAGILVAALVLALVFRPLDGPVRGDAAAALVAAPGTPANARALTPQAIMPIARATAENINAAVPLVAGPNPAASAFVGILGNATAFDRAAQCLTSAIYYEAANESDAGQRAVAQVVLNRVRHPAYPNSVCGVVYQGSNLRTGCQFSFTCDGSLARRPSTSGWARARSVALAALGGSVYAPVGLSTHYHANYVVPYWQASLTKTAVIGAHIFYRWPRGAGRPAAFSSRYAGQEPDIAARLAAASAAGEAAALTGGVPTTGEVWKQQPALLKPIAREDEAAKHDAFGLLDYRGSKTGAVAGAAASAPVSPPRGIQIDSAVASAVAQSNAGQ